MPIWGTIITGAVGAAIGHYFQSRSWNHQHESAQLDAEMQTATKLFEEMSSKVDTRYNTMRWVWWGFKSDVDDDEVAKRWQAYQQELLNWRNNQSKNQALTLLYFGRETNKCLEDEVQAGFKSLNDKLAVLRYDNPKPAERQRLVDESGEEMETFRQKVHHYNLLMVRALQRQDIGTFRQDAAELSKLVLQQRWQED